MVHKRLLAGELSPGTPIPWRVFDASGRLLLREGHRFADEAAIEAFVAREVYRGPTDDEARQLPAKAPPQIDPFATLIEHTQRLARGLVDLACMHCADANAWAMSLVDVVESLDGMHVDAVLGALLLMDELKYSISHAWMVATVCDLMARRLALPDAQRRSFVAAAFTSNVGMLQVQDLLSSQPGPMTPEQDAIVKHHPVRSRQLLAAAGVHDSLWLSATLQHHERLDGSGYPRGLKDEAVVLGARLLALADIYAAMILPRTYRDGVHAKEALREIFMQRGSRIDAGLASLFIKEIGVFPPGVFVKLANGETAVVVRRNPRHANKPIISSLLNPFGTPLERPLIRDSAEASPYAIVDVLPRQALPFALARIWGYGA